MSTRTANGEAVVDLPDGWAVDPALAEAAAVDLVALGPRTPAFTSNVVVAVSDIGTLPLDEWLDGTDALLDRTLAGYLIVDRTSEGDTGSGQVRRLAAYTTEDGVDVTLAQRALVRDGHVATATVTVPTERYPDDETLVSQVLTSLTWSPA